VAVFCLAEVDAKHNTPHTNSVKINTCHLSAISICNQKHLSLKILIIQNITFAFHNIYSKEESILRQNLHLH
jgi:hypothetical protein